MPGNNPTSQEIYQFERNVLSANTFEKLEQCIRNAGFTLKNSQGYPVDIEKLIQGLQALNTHAVTLTKTFVSQDPYNEYLQFVQSYHITGQYGIRDVLKLLTVNKAQRDLEEKRQDQDREFARLNQEYQSYRDLCKEHKMEHFVPILDEWLKSKVYGVKADPFIMLGLQNNASVEDIRANYGKFQKELHPDRNKAIRNIKENVQFKEIMRNIHASLPDYEQAAKRKADDKGILIDKLVSKSASEQKQLLNDMDDIKLCELFIYAKYESGADNRLLNTIKDQMRTRTTIKMHNYDQDMLMEEIQKCKSRYDLELLMKDLEYEPITDDGLHSYEKSSLQDGIRENDVSKFSGIDAIKLKMTELVNKEITNALEMVVKHISVFKKATQISTIDKSDVSYANFKSEFEVLINKIATKVNGADEVIREALLSSGNDELKNYIKIDIESGGRIFSSFINATKSHVEVLERSIKNANVDMSTPVSGQPTSAAAPDSLRTGNAAEQPGGAPPVVATSTPSESQPAEQQTPTPDGTAAEPAGPPAGGNQQPAAPAAVEPSLQTDQVKSTLKTTNLNKKCTREFINDMVEKIRQCPQDTMYYLAYVLLLDQSHRKEAITAEGFNNYQELLGTFISHATSEQKVKIKELYISGVDSPNAVNNSLQVKKFMALKSPASSSAAETTEPTKPATASEQQEQPAPATPADTQPTAGGNEQQPAIPEGTAIPGGNEPTQPASDNTAEEQITEAARRLAAIHEAHDKLTAHQTEVQKTIPYYRFGFHGTKDDASQLFINAPAEYIGFIKEKLKQSFGDRVYSISRHGSLAIIINPASEKDITKEFLEEHEKNLKEIKEKIDLEASSKEDLVKKIASCSSLEDLKTLIGGVNHPLFTKSGSSIPKENIINFIDKVLNGEISIDIASRFSSEKADAVDTFKAVYNLTSNYGFETVLQRILDERLRLSREQAASVGGTEQTPEANPGGSEPTQPAVGEGAPQAATSTPEGGSPSAAPTAASSPSATASGQASAAPAPIPQSDAPATPQPSSTSGQPQPGSSVAPTPSGNTARPETGPTASASASGQASAASATSSQSGAPATSQSSSTSGQPQPANSATQRQTEQRHFEATPEPRQRQDMMHQQEHNANKQRVLGVANQVQLGNKWNKQQNNNSVVYDKTNKNKQKKHMEVGCSEHGGFKITGNGPNIGKDIGKLANKMIANPSMQNQNLKYSIKAPSNEKAQQFIIELAKGGFDIAKLSIQVKGQAPKNLEQFTDSMSPDNKQLFTASIESAKGYREEKDQRANRPA